MMESMQNNVTVVEKYFFFQRLLQIEKNVRKIIETE